MFRYVKEEPTPTWANHSDPRVLEMLQSMQQKAEKDKELILTQVRQMLRPSSPVREM